MKIKLLLINLSVIAILAVSLIIGSEYYTARPEFCGSCHMMKSYYDSWRKSKHGEKNVACVVCHYAPKERSDIDANFKGLGQLLTYFSYEGREIRMPTKVSDPGCMTSECHPVEKFMDKKIRFTEKVPFIHRTHEEKTIEGQKLHCDTCHQNITIEKHFEVTEQVCFLCHFKNTDFNEGRAKCSHCHEIPTKPLQKQKKESKPDENPITHQSLEKAKVPCQSCHYEIIQGKGEVRKQNCFNCHNYSFDLDSKSGEKRLMHTEHVAGQHVAGQLAKCFDCHEPIQHKVAEFLDPVRLNCLTCHPDHHMYQKMLLVGEERKGISKTPGLMFGVNTTCLGCHRDERTVRGEKVVHGTGKACAACHTERHEDMAQEWKDKTGKELLIAKEIENEALEAIKNAEKRVSAGELEKAIAMLTEGQKNMRIVEFGGGVHNKKYSIMLLDSAMNSFEEVVDLLLEEEAEEEVEVRED
jgi:nitrate/TMAO reductase-like tetraheme cytochrome c subunit